MSEMPIDMEMTPEEEAAFNEMFENQQKMLEKSALDATLDERGARYGVFSKHANVSQALKKTLFYCRAKGSLADDQAEALEMICHKLARIVNGDPDYADSWLDIAGYAQLVADRLSGIER